MIFDDWVFDSYNSDNFYETLKISDLPKWPEWKQRISDVLADMTYEDASQCEFKDLISLAGIEGEIDLALKQSIEDHRLKQIKKDF